MSTDAPMSTGGAGDDEPVADDFDQTNGVVEGLEGESDGTAEGDDLSDADRDGEIEPRPIGNQDQFMTDHYGDDPVDPNP